MKFKYIITLASAFIASNADCITHKSITQELKACQSAWNAAKNRDWSKAIELAKKDSCKNSKSAITWLALQESNAGLSLNEIDIFITQHKHWPSIAKIERQVENDMKIRANNSQIISWFSHKKPKSAAGSMSYIEALLASGKEQLAQEVIRYTWRNVPLNDSQESKFYAKYGKHLKADDHFMRTDRLLWIGEKQSAKAMLRHLSPRYHNWLKARLALQNYSSDAQILLTNVPSEMMNQPGLVFDRLRYYKKHDNLKGASLINSNVVNKEQAKQWWKMACFFSREAITQLNYDLAYKVMREFPHQDRNFIDEAEFQMGYIALTFQNKPELAFEHFSKSYESANTTPSKAKAAYWAAHSLKGLKDNELSKAWLEKGTISPASFYGQLCLEDLGRKIEITLHKSKPKLGPSIENSFDQKTMVKAARLLAANGYENSVNGLVYNLFSNAKNNEERILAGELVNEIAPSYSVEFSRAMIQTMPANRDWMFPTKYIPSDLKLDRSLVSAIIHKESNYNKNSISSVGALGLMQLMPNTARIAAKQLNVPYSEKRLLKDGSYNVQLGTFHLNKVYNRYNGSYVLATAAYNAGDTPVTRWIRNLGLPPSSNFELAKWIEQIPYTETRLYVKLVLATKNVYKFARRR